MGFLVLAVKSVRVLSHFQLPDISRPHIRFKFKAARGKRNNLINAELYCK
jgi:hypothetical protein